MNVSVLDKIGYYLLLLYALASSISIAAANLAVSLAAVLALIRHIKEPIELNFDKNLLIYISLFFTAGLLSSAFSSESLRGIDTLWGYLYRMFPMFLAILFLKRSDQLLQVIVVMAISIGIADVYAIWQGMHHNYRAMAFTSNPMIMAGFLIQMIPVLLLMGFEYPGNNRAMKFFFLTSTIISIIALGFNGTRGAWLAVGVLLVAYILINIKRNKKASISVLLLLCMCAVATINPHIQNKISSFTDIKTNKSNVERLLLWESSWRIFKDYPILGIGPGSFRKVYNEQYISPQAKVQYLGHAHNNFLHILAEEGILGFISFMTIYIYILYSSFQSYRRGFVLSGILFFCTLTLLIQGLTEFNFGDSAVIRMYWFIVGLAYAEQFKYE